MARFIVPSMGSKETQPGIPLEAISGPPPAKMPTAAPPTLAKRKPAPPPANPDEPEEMEVEEVEDRPTRKRHKDAEADDRPRSKRRDDPDDEEEDDPPRRKRRDDENEDEDRPRRRRVKRRQQSSGGSKTPMILALVGAGVVLLLCCGGVGVFALIGNRNVDGGGVNVVFGPDGTFRSDGALRIWDPTKDRRHFRLYNMPVEAGKTYEINMTSRNLDAYLVLLDENNLVVAEDDDSGGNLNARIIYTSQRAATFRIEASTFDDHETGSFTLVVRRR
jgi:hypothetical protein